ncbi:splicing regulatory glutamine/lysine-rich protein 1 isoform X2 [Canis lupus baileyi]|uniref:splicing regulatory glutamine/lysine-rich protein 1 isoform X2 n=1 Tax=Canis lupus familiaris TaxID=9615 RepID=UPI0003AE7F14|nr:splicing regulatory glutamine/lysine-rich protein 1 isoform X2 [Canis lupus familiaris]XP_025304039.1 splicing regulatory glutamine/lysine-rich protein 1 isoform X2 [Canis lupus dingo]XP_038386683.1 splicing regulatory glutamine/lysine-rich protein 1 isoform X2 [Canis lupus familiaris]XP_038514981.1 splicing regulatory glutamine/lysine-rich protein 1 isoform X2 [Canis lupus familiaris]|eukprot:XP_005617510.1 splicing regulatory glutamine/lysine-rich protein 1 isoform X2 [Canis lupus familiaris]
MNSGGGFGLALGFGLTPTAVIQVTNLSSAVTSEQMRTLFSFLGEIEELRLYPPDFPEDLETQALKKSGITPQKGSNAPLAFSSKVCYVKFRDPSSVGVAQHLTNTVFIDRALIVVPCAEGKIPEESKALSLLAPAPTMTSLMPGAGLLPIPTPNPLTTLGVSLSSLGAIPAAALDPNIATLGEIPQPPLMGNVDPSKIDEIRRTVYVGNLNSQTTTADQLLEFFKQVGEVKFVRMAGDETQPTRFAFVEFADQNSVPRALAFNGVMFGDRPLKINHSNNAIVKPPEMTPQAAAKELEEVMKRVREAQSFISAAIEPESGKSNERKGGRSRSHTRSKSRSSSKSHSRRKRSQSKHRSRSHNRSRSRQKDRRRSKSPHKKRSKSRERRKSRSRSRSRDKRKDTREKIKEKERVKEKDREKEREKERDREKEREKEKERGKNKDKEREKDRDKDKEKDRERERDKEHDKERDKEKEKEQDKEKERDKDRSKEIDEKRKKDKKSRTPPRSYNASRRSRSSSRERRRRRSRSSSRSPRTSKTIKRKSSRSPSPRRNKKDKKREKERDHISERRERERSSSTRKSSNDRDGKEKLEKNNTSLKEKEHSKEPDLSVGKEVDDKDAPRTEENKVQQNGNCQPNEENLSTKTEAV